MPFARRRSRAGFSLIEALVVLAIGGMAMMLVFGIGARATETGFRLGRTALAAADDAVSTESYRALIEGLVLAPGNAVPATYRLEPVYVAETFVTGDAVLSRGTACAPAGPVRGLRLEIQPVEGGGSQLACSRAGSDDAVILLTSDEAMTFSVSFDAQTWLTGWTNDIELPVATGEDVLVMTEQKLWVRLTDETGQVDVVGMASSGRPANYYVREQFNLS